MKNAKVCPHCEGTLDLPHRSETDCFNAVDREIKAALAHLRTLTKRKSALLRARIHNRRRVVVGRRRGSEN